MLDSVPLMLAAMFLETHRSPRLIWWAALVFASTAFVFSWWRWWTFQYATFDLAFYVQGLWLASHAQWNVSLLNVPILGNHAEPIVFLATPLFALWPHPMLLVGLQTAALATMPFTAARIARQLGFSPRAAALLAVAIVLMPATGFVALHEFHPEAFAAPLLLLLIEARLASRLGKFWFWFVAVLSCKENLCLGLIAFCGVHAVLDWRRGKAWEWRWNGLPLLTAAAWFAVYTVWIGPALNAGNVDYLELYSHLGSSAREIIASLFAEPRHAFAALRLALTGGDLLPGLLLPLLGLPLLRPRWMIIAAPLLLQHLLSWRSSEWSIRFHYAAPLIPLCWIGAAEAVIRMRRSTVIAACLLIACGAGQLWFGPAKTLPHECVGIEDRLWERTWKAEMLGTIRTDASVTAGLPYLSHLALRRELYSLHHLSKGLKTLSRAEFTPPPPTEVVVIDYADTATFSTASGYYHPQMRTADLRIVPASDRLLHEFLRQNEWRERSRNALRIYTRGERERFNLPSKPASVTPGTILLALQASPQGPGDTMEFRFEWEFTDERKSFPWLMLVLTHGSTARAIVKGPCAHAADLGRFAETWSVALPQSPAGMDEQLMLLFYDNTSAAWQDRLPPADRTFVFGEIPLGPRNRDLLGGKSQ